MNVLDLVAKLSSGAEFGLTVNADRCVHALDIGATCEVCAVRCPTQALSLTPGVTLNREACVACGSCVNACPVGVFAVDDGDADILRCGAALGNRGTVELVCAAHPQPGLGLPGAAAIRAPRCLAALGPAVYLGLLAQGFDTVIARLDYCAGCPIGAVRREIEGALRDTTALLDAGQATQRARGVDQPPAGAWQKRAVYDAKQPPVSRRNLLRLFRPEPQAEAPTLIRDDPSAGAAPPKERRLLLKAIRRLVAPAALDPAAPLALDGFVQIEADETCSACGSCARACPTGALRFQVDGDHFWLAHSAGACTDCGVCLDVCEPQALRRAGAPAFQAVVEPEPRLLREGALRACGRCGAKYAGPEDSGLCPVCAFRRQHPFGSRLPRQLAVAPHGRPRQPRG